MSLPQSDKIRRNLRALFVVGFLFALLAGIAGGIILTLGYPRPHVVQPVWKFGQWMMFYGMVHFCIYLSIHFQVRRLARGNAGLS